MSKQSLWIWGFKSSITGYRRHVTEVKPKDWKYGRHPITGDNKPKEELPILVRGGDGEWYVEDDAFFTSREQAVEAASRGLKNEIDKKKKAIQKHTKALRELEQEMEDLREG